MGTLNSSDEIPMNASPFPLLPVETADIARSLFNIENVYLSIGDQIEPLFGDINPADLDASGEERAGTLWLLAMVTIFQFAEDLPDRQAAEAIRKRTDWKYALHLSMDCPDFNPGALCEFRQRLLLNTSGQRVFQRMLAGLADVGLLDGRIKDWTDARYVLLAVCTLSRVDHLVQSLRLALEALAAFQPELLRVATLPHWYDRYFPFSSTIKLPRCHEDQEALVQAIGKDAQYLLDVVTSIDVPDVAQIPEFESLRRTWHQQFQQNRSQAMWREGCSLCRLTTLIPPSRR